MSLKDDSFPSSTAFDTIQASLNTTPTSRTEAIKSGAAIFGFKLKNTAGAEAAWHIDLKHSGTVGRGEAPAGKKADVTLSMADEDFGKLVAGTAKAQNMFMSGKMKIRGNIMKATRLEGVMARVREDGREGGVGKPKL